METMVYPMGGGATKLYGVLAQTFSSSSSSSSSPLSQPHLDPHHQQHPHMDLDPACCQQEWQPLPLCPPDPLELLRECEEALRDRPPRFHRNLVRVGDGEPSSPIRVMQWNILAQALGEGVDDFVRCPPEALSWSQRKYLILEEILTYRPHILCLQEVDHFHDTFRPILASLGYRGNFCPKPWSPCLDVEGNNGPDGCALFFDQSRFEFVDNMSLRLSAMMIPTNQVAVVTVLRCRASGRCVYVAATHLKARSGWERLRCAQGCDLLRQLQSFIQKRRGGPVPPPGTDADTAVLICGDFNAVPTEEVYRRYASSPLGLDSAYKKASRDGATEPEYTTWKIRPTGECCSTLDYIWYSQNRFTVEAVLDMPTEEQIGPNRLPSYNYPSDHLSLVCDFSFKEKDRKMTENTDVE